MTIDQNLTDKSRILFDALSSQRINIELQVRPDLREKLEGAGWGVIPTYQIICDRDDADPAAFAHELLHIYLLTNDFKDGDLIYKTINEPNHMFSRDFLIATNNNLAHYKMIEKFVGMGFDRSRFFGSTLGFQFDETYRHVKSISTSDRPTMMQQFINS